MVSKSLFGTKGATEKWPKTTSIEDMAKLSQKFLNEAVDHDDSCRPYFYCFYGKTPPELTHNVWDHSEDLGRFLYASVFSRIILGQEEEPEIEQLWKKLIYESIADGEAFSCRPLPDPYDPFRDVAAEERSIAVEDYNYDFEFDMWDNRSVFTGLYLSYLATGDSKAKECALRMIDRIKELSITKGNWAYLSRFQYPAGYMPDSFEQPAAGQNMLGWISPLVFAYEQTGDRSLIELARGYSQCFIDMWPESFHDFPENEISLGFNTHAFFYGLAGIIRCAKHLWIPKFISWSKHHFDEILKELGSSMGWIAEQFPSAILGKVPQSCETCTLVDAIDVAIQLAKCGYPEYWDIAERFFKNYFYEAQLKDTSWIEVSENKQETTMQYSNVNVPERIKGAFVGWGAPNDFVDPTARRYRALQNCCAPHGVFGEYMVWNNIITFEENNISTGEAGVFINMHLNRDTKYAKVKSYAPYEGLLEVNMHKSNRLFIRIPEGVNQEQISVEINGEISEFKYVHPFIDLGQLGEETVVLVKYPLIEKSEFEVINGQNYLLTWKGNYVVNISPSGDVAPLFKRSEMKKDKAPITEMSLNKSECTIEW